MLLYYFSLSPYSKKVLIALAEKNIPCDTQNINLFDKADRGKYIAFLKTVSSLGRLPVLVNEDEVVLESTIIVEYLNDRFVDGPALIPADKEAARAVRLKTQMADHYITAPARDLFFQNRLASDSQDEKLVKRSQDTLTNTYTYFNGELAKSTWIHSDMFSMADCTAIAAFNMAHQLFPIADEYDQIHRYLDQAIERPSVQKVLASE